jgi:hypothetical protein
MIFDLTFDVSRPPTNDELTLAIGIISKVFEFEKSDIENELSLFKGISPDSPLNDYYVCVETALLPNP